MKLLKIVKNENGAALLLTLFLIAFVAIIGASLLNTTLYGKKSNVVALADQQEFYRLEGAIDLLLYEMRSFYREDGILMYDDGVNPPFPVTDANDNPIPVVKAGPYYYIEMGQPLTLTYQIDGELVQVEITNVVSNNGSGTKQYSFSIRSKYDDAQKFEREISLSATVPDQDRFIEIDPPPTPSGPSEPGIPSFPGIVGQRIISHNPPTLGGNSTSSATYQPHVSRTQTGVSFQSFINFYGLDISQATGSWDATTPQSVTPIRLFNTIHTSGANTNAAIPYGFLTYANSVVLDGCGGDGSINIGGVLMAKSFIVKGNCTVRLSGGIIAETFLKEGNNTLVVFGDGFTDDGGAGGYEPPPPPPRELPMLLPSDYNWGIDTNIQVTNMTTNRN